MKVIIKNGDLVFQRKPISEEINKLFQQGYKKNPGYTKLIELEKLINTLISNGIWDKIEHLFIPIFGTDNTDFMLDIKQSYGNTNTAMVFPENYIAKDEENGGIMGTGTVISTSPWCGSLIPTIDVVSGDFHAACFLTKFGGISNPPSALSKIQLSTWNPDCDFTLNGSGNSLYPQSNANVRAINFNLPIISSHKAGEDCVIETEFNNGNLVTGTSTDSLRYDGKTYPLYFLLTEVWQEGGTGSNSGSRGIKYYSTGKALSDEEMKTYSSVIREFFNNITID